MAGYSALGTGAKPGIPTEVLGAITGEKLKQHLTKH